MNGRLITTAIQGGMALTVVAGGAGAVALGRHGKADTLQRQAEYDAKLEGLRGAAAADFRDAHPRPEPYIDAMNASLVTLVGGMAIGMVGVSSGSRLGLAAAAVGGVAMLVGFGGAVAAIGASLIDG